VTQHIYLRQIKQISPHLDTFHNTMAEVNCYVSGEKRTLLP